MANNYQFFDANSSILTAAAEDLGGVYQPIVRISSILTPISLGNTSISGTIGASILGTVPVTQSGAWSASVVGTLGVSSILTIPGIVSTANSSTATLGGGAAFTGTSEDVKDFASITISVFADQASGTDGLSIQQSSNGTNWDITDVYTIAASTGKTFSVQPAARFFRIVYTNGATPQGAFRLQTVYHITATKASSQRPGDSYTNETDLEQNQSFGMVFNGTTWDRMRGTTTAGVLINPGASSVLTRQSGTVITSVSGTVAVTQSGAWTHSVVGTVNVGSTVGAVTPFTQTSDYVWGTTSTLTGTTAGSVLAAPGASLRNYITHITITNAAASAAIVDIRDSGANVLYTAYAAASGGGVAAAFPVPIRQTTTNASIDAVPRSQASILVSASGFRAA